MLTKHPRLVVVEHKIILTIPSLISFKNWYQRALLLYDTRFSEGDFLGWALYMQQLPLQQFFQHFKWKSALFYNIRQSLNALVSNNISSSCIKYIIFTAVRFTLKQAHKLWKQFLLVISETILHLVRSQKPISHTHRGESEAKWRRWKKSHEIIMLCKSLKFHKQRKY